VNPGRENRRSLHFASLGMTIRLCPQELQREIFDPSKKLSSRPERSVVEGPAVSFPRTRSRSSIKPHKVGLAFAGLEIAGNLRRAFLIVALWSNPDPMPCRAGELDYVRGMVFARELVA
jgi:hypothetical protein